MTYWFPRNRCDMERQDNLVKSASIFTIYLPYIFFPFPCMTSSIGNFFLCHELFKKFRIYQIVWQLFDTLDSVEICLSRKIITKHINKHNDNWTIRSVRNPKAVWKLSEDVQNGIYKHQGKSSGHIRYTIRKQ